ncbi:11577_t:CDS:2 [Cetraspora pellucida]|uniref:11577_t:CDS:1 n=1 Tax=Cetraspora pellucida TaxID=1433469 RepID=A0ACA9KH49_9GLOM|nr:11577_t:CDS:2 [Cetraspora pellucida]
MLFIDEPNTVYGNLNVNSRESYNEVRSACADEGLGNCTVQARCVSNPCNVLDWECDTSEIGQCCENPTKQRPKNTKRPKSTKCSKRPKGKGKAAKEQPISVSASGKAIIGNAPKNGPPSNICQPREDVCRPCGGVCRPCEDVYRRDEYINMQSRQFDNILCTPYSVSPCTGLDYDICGCEQPSPEIFIIPQCCESTEPNVSASGKATIDFEEQPKGKVPTHSNVCQPCDNVCQRNENIQSRQLVDPRY